MPKILIAEDEVSLARSMGESLTAAGHDVRIVHAGEKVLREFKAFGPDLVLLDVRLGGVSGLNLLAEIKAESPDTDAIVVTAYGSVEVAVEAMKRGAADFLSKPLDLDVLCVAVDKVWAASQDRRRLEQFRSAEEERLRGVALLGECAAMVAIRDQVSRLASRVRQGGPNTVVPPILLTGETGTGKDLLANWIHAALSQRSGPFIALNCSAVPTELFESELFGHQRGSFSGATADKPGLFELAHEGTLFLDEIGDLPPAMQPKLLRALETQTIRRIGDTRDRSFNVCLLAATNRNLSELVQAGKFREDLFYRLRVITIELPPLRSRGEDVVLIADHFCRQLGSKYGIAGLTLADPAREALRHYDWPGNIRELRHALESTALRIMGATIELEDLAGSLQLPRLSDPVQRAQRRLEQDQPINLEEVEKSLIQQALRRTGGNASAAARLLSIGREAMRYRMAKFSLGGGEDAESLDSRG